MTTDNSTFSCCSSTSPKIIAARPRSYKRHQEADWNEPKAAVCHQLRPRPARRRRRSLNQNSWVRSRTGPWNSMHGWIFVVFLSIVLCCQQVDAGNAHGSHLLHRRTDLLFDKRGPPEPRMRLKPRSEASHRVDPTDHRHRSGSITEDPGLATAGQESLIPLPHPFDTSLGNNFTAISCPTFFNTFLTNDTFNACLPLSLLLQVCIP